MSERRDEGLKVSGTPSGSRRKRAVREMMEEDSDLLAGRSAVAMGREDVDRIRSSPSPLTPTTAADSTTVPSSPTPSHPSPIGSPSKKSNLRVKLHFAGRVYRTLQRPEEDEMVVQSVLSGSPKGRGRKKVDVVTGYSPNGDLLGMPDEVSEGIGKGDQVGGMERFVRSGSPTPLPASSSPSSSLGHPLTPQKRIKSRVLSARLSTPPGASDKGTESNEDEDLQIEPPLDDLVSTPKLLFSSPSSSIRTRPTIQPLKKPKVVSIPEHMPLPAKYQSILNLHKAIEKAVLIHLATEGGASFNNASSASASSSSTEDRLSTPRKTRSRTVEDRVEKVVIPNLINYQTLKPLVERCSEPKRSFKVDEFEKLVWIWEDPESLGSKGDEDRGGGATIGFTVSRSSTVQPNSTSNPVSTKPMKATPTWTLGIEMSLKMNPSLPSFEVLSPSPSKPSKVRSKGLDLEREGMSVIAMWNSKAEERKMEVERRLRAVWERSYQGFLDQRTETGEGTKRRETSAFEDVFLSPDTPPITPRKDKSRRSSSKTKTASTSPSTRTSLVNPSSHLPTPPSSRKRHKAPTRPAFSFHPDYNPSDLPDVPRSKLPDLSSPAPKRTSTSVVTARKRAGKKRDQASSGPFTPQGREKRVRVGPVEEDAVQEKAELGGGDEVEGGERSLGEKERSATQRSMSLLERIKAKQASSHSSGSSYDLDFLSRPPSSSSSSLKRSSNGISHVLVEKMDNLRRKSMLSRLSDVADAIYMLFPTSNTPPSPSASSLPTPPTRNRKARPLHEVSGLIAKSSKISLSEVEAKDSIRLLCDLCPGFTSIRRVDRQDWIFLTISASASSGSSDVAAMGLREVKERIRLELEK